MLEVLTEVSAWTRSEITERLKAMRQDDVTETIGRCGADGVVWESLPRPLQRWMYARSQEWNGRQDH